MGVIRYKIWSDLWANKGRTLTIVLIIGIGAAALGMIVGTQSAFVEVMESGWRSINPAMIGMYAGPEVDDQTIDVLKRIDGLEDVEGYAQGSIEWRHSPAEDWQAGNVVAREDFANQRYNKVMLADGLWPEEKNFGATVPTTQFFNLPIGSQIIVKARNREFVVTITGAMDDQVTQPPSFGGLAQFYATQEWLEELTDIDGYNRILAGAYEFDPDKVTDIADEMKRKLEKQDVESGGFMPPAGDRIVDPNKHFFQDNMNAIFMILGVLAALALLLSLLLVYNTINATISQQIDQIGIMKAIGARTGQILVTFLLMVLGYSLLAMLISLPLGAVAGYGMTVFLASSFDADVGGFFVSRPALIAQLIVVIGAPFLAAVVPIISGSRITVNQAINTYGLQAKPSRLDRLLAKIKRIPRLILLMVSNTFRKKGRVFLTEITLVLSGLIFMMVMSARDSVAYTFGDVLFSIMNFDVNLLLEEPERIDNIETLTLAHPDVEAVEMWSLNNSTARLAGQEASEDDESAILFGVPLPTRLYGVQMRAGRWLTPEDSFAVVLNERLAADIGANIGDWVTFDHGVAGESTWRVVGLVFDPVFTESASMPRDILLRVLGSPGKAQSIWIQTRLGDPASQESAAKDLRAYYEDHFYDINPAGIFGDDTSSGITATIVDQFASIISLLMIMAVVIGIVGSITLSGTLSLGVIERRREIGVMRAVGASSMNIGLLLIGEGLILGWLSWAIALPLSIPAGRIMTEAIGATFNLSIVYKYTFTGALIWFGIITILAIVASWLPARNAIGISVRESLAYQ